VEQAEIESLLVELADELEQEGVRGELLLVGGAAMALAYSTRRSTADLDAVFEPKLVIYEVASRMAERRGLDPGWLNDAVKAFLPGPDPNATVFFDRPGLVVRIASPRYLLAMKLLASRVERDEDDIRVLLRLSNITDPGEALQLVADLYPDSAIPAKVEYLVRELLE
jgi:hypothetical protein